RRGRRAGRPLKRSFHHTFAYSHGLIDISTPSHLPSDCPSGESPACGSSPMRGILETAAGGPSIWMSGLLIGPRVPLRAASPSIFPHPPPIRGRVASSAGGASRWSGLLEPTVDRGGRVVGSSASRPTAPVSGGS